MKIYLLIIFALLNFSVYAQSGFLDNTFGIGGKVITDLGSSDDVGYSLAIQGDGKIVVGGSSGIYPNIAFVLVRYNSDGTLDNSFDSDGRVTTNFDGFYDQCRSIAIQNDGKIIVAGLTMIGNFFEYDFAIARYNSDGTLDNTFGSGGKVITAIGNGNDVGLSVALQSDGKIVLTGYSFIGNNDDIAVVRYNSDGNLDNTFSYDGKVTTSIGDPNVYGENVYNYPNSVSIQNDGKIVVAGYNENGGYSDEGDDCNADFALVRYESNGDLDNTFGSGGIVITEFGSYYEKANSIVIQIDGKIVVAGMSYNGTAYDFALLRYNNDGTLDSTFNSDGKVATNIGSSSKGYSVALQNDGKIVVAGCNLNGSDYDFALIRYSSDGTLDCTFDTDGKTTTDFGNYNDVGMSVAIQNDGKIVVAGHSWNGSNVDFAIVRYDGDGGTVGIEENTEMRDMNIYPNPTSGIFTVDLRNCLYAKICVYDVLGSCLLKKDCQNEESPKIDLSSQPGGIYFMEVVSDSERAVKKIVLE